jgi:tRNA(adenine34) deaminase
MMGEPVELTKFDKTCFDRAVVLAQEAENAGNLPVGAVIALKGKIIAEGKSAIWQPELRLHKHAEMEALREIPKDLTNRGREMTLYTTLEPCLMCFGAIMLHGIGRLVFGSADDFGGASSTFDHLPDFFDRQFQNMEWIGPIYTQACDLLYARLTEIENIK